MVLLFLVFFVQLSESQTTLDYPYVQRNVCPFECCQYGMWLTQTPLRAYQIEGDTTILAFTIASGDSFTALSGNVHMERPGMVIVTKPIYEFIPSDTLYTLSYFGEGYINVFRNGKTTEVEMFWGPVFEEDTCININDPKWAQYSGVLVERALMIWWVHIHYWDGREGWLRLVNTTNSGFRLDEEIDGMDACG